MMKERGNILFLILLAIVLFGALTYAIMGSQREYVNTGIPKEKADTLASQLVQNASLIENTMMRAMLVDGVPEWGFDVSGSVSTSLPNATCTSAKCRIYTSNGGSVPDLMLPEWASTDTTNTAGKRMPYFYVLQVLDVKTSAPELVLRYDEIRKEVCDAVNRQMGYTDIDLTLSDTMSYGGSASGTSYQGTLTAFPAGLNAGIGDVVTSLKGRKTFCYRAGSLGYYFAHVLMER